MINEINEKNSLFLIIDIQEKLINATEEKIKEQTEKNSVILAKASNILKIKTIITEQYPKGLGKTIKEIKENVSTNTIFFEKYSFDATLTDGLIEKLKEKENIFIFGIETHICVFQTVISLLNKNFNVFVIKDACASRKKDQFQTSINLMKQEGAKIITTEMVLFEFLKSSKHPNFKEIQALIK